MLECFKYKNMKQFLLDAFSKGDLYIIFETLKKTLIDDKKSKEILLQFSRYNDLKEQIRLGMIDHETANITKNKINVSVLELINEVDSNIQSYSMLLSNPQPITFNIKNENGIPVKFKSEALKRIDDIIIPKDLTLNELIQALLANYNIMELITGRNHFSNAEYYIIINHVKYKGSLNEFVRNVPINEGDLLMIKGRLILSFIGSNDLT